MADPNRDTETPTGSRPFDDVLRHGDAWDPIDERRALSSIKAGLLGRPAAPPTGDRYLPVERIGAGGVGVVYRAYDSKLRREVALKMVRPRGTGTESDAEAKARLLREAQALASFSHPNIVAVYDIGDHEDEVFIAMEYVEGTDLAKWIRDEQRDWRTVLDVFVRAGGGLAAAHAAGILHRDFKPSNVLLDASMRPRIIDFGLARLADDVAIETTPTSRSKGDGDDAADDSLRIPAAILGDTPDALSTQLTVVGTVMGTPGYMAPEQYRSQATTARSDQFSFCVALYEGLYGQLPFAARTKEEIAEFLEDGQVRAAPDRTKVPNRIHRALVRGLSLDPDARFPTMDALLGELAHDPWRRRKQWIAGGAIVAGLGAAWGFAGVRADVCGGGDDRIAGVWGPKQARAIEDAFDATGVTFAADAAQRVRHHLDDYTSRWVRSHRGACEATKRGEQSAELLDRRMACYERAVREVDALVGVLAEADTQVVETAISTTLDLTRLAACEPDRVLLGAAQPPEDDQTAKEVEDVRDRLAQVRIIAAAGKKQRAANELEELVARADALGYAPLDAEVAFQTGSVAASLSDFEGAVGNLRKAYFTGLANGHDRVAARAAISLLELLITWKGDTAGFEWEDHARAEIARIGEAPLLAADLQAVLGSANFSLGHTEPALAHWKRAQQMYEAELGPKSHETAGLLAGIANGLSAAAKYDEAAPFAERSVEMSEELYGPAHPALGWALAGLAEVRRMQGRLDEAERDFARALEIIETSYDSETVAVAEAHNGMGILLATRGRFRDSREAFQRAERIWRALGNEELSHATAVMNIAESTYVLGELEEAREGYRAALETWKAAYEPAHPSVVVATSNLARVETMLGNHEVALALHERVLADGPELLGADHPMLAQSYSGRGWSRLATGEVEGAVTDLERALELTRHETGEDDINYAEIHEGLARALVATDRERARKLATEARLWYAERPELGWRLRPLERWMAENDLR